MRTLGCITEFLGVGQFPAIAPMAANVRHYERPMRTDEWDWLAGQFAAEIRDIESLLGWDCRDWLRRPAVGP